MNVGLVVVGSDTIVRAGADVPAISRALSLKGYDVFSALNVCSSDDPEKYIAYIKDGAGAVLVTGEFEKVKDYLSSLYTIAQDADVVEIEDIIYGFMAADDNSFIEEKFIPALNSKCRTFYNTFIIKTFGSTQKQLREALSSCIKNRSRITFRFFETPLECEIHIKYSSKMSKEIVDAVITSAARSVKDVTYAYSDVSLVERVAALLIKNNIKLCVAESFTGGAIASALVSVPGISSVFKEGIVAYSNESKMRRLNVDGAVINTYGAVSIETAYEMAAGILQRSGCDFSLATTGNAGPTAEKEGGEGLCFIAVGNMKGIHIYKYNFTGSRGTIIESGVKAAFFNLYKKLAEAETE